MLVLKGDSPESEKITKFKMSFDFDPSKREYKKNLEIVNAALDTMKVSKLEIENIQGYIVIKKTFNEGELASINYDYGFDKIEFICKQSDDKGLHVFRMDVAAFSGEKFNSEEFVAQWSKEHPDRILRLMSTNVYDEGRV